MRLRKSYNNMEHIKDFIFGYVIGAGIFVVLIKPILDSLLDD